MNSQTSERLAAPSQGELPVQQAVALSDELRQELENLARGFSTTPLRPLYTCHTAQEMDEWWMRRNSENAKWVRDCASQAIAILAAAHAEPAQQPVATVNRECLGAIEWDARRPEGRGLADGMPLYASPLAQPVNEELVDLLQRLTTAASIGHFHTLLGEAKERLAAIAKATGERAGQAALPKADEEDSTTAVPGQINTAALLKALECGLNHALQSVKGAHFEGGRHQYAADADLIRSAIAMLAALPGSAE